MTILLLLAALALPDRVMTPGLVRPLTLETICTTKWGRDRRHVTTAMRRQLFVHYGKRWSTHRNYEVDHLVPRELGGADDLRNLWPQPWPDARRKDREENRLHKAVCAGTMALPDAQEAIRRWGR